MSSTKTSDRKHCLAPFQNKTWDNYQTADELFWRPPYSWCRWVFHFGRLISPYRRRNWPFCCERNVDWLQLTLSNWFELLRNGESASFVSQTSSKNHRIDRHDQSFKSSRFCASNQVDGRLPEVKQSHRSLNPSASLSKLIKSEEKGQK